MGAIGPRIVSITFPVPAVGGAAATLRAAPAGLDPNSVNWMCRIPQADFHRHPTPAEIATALAEGTHWAAILHADRGPPGFAPFVAGSIGVPG